MHCRCLARVTRSSMRTRMKLAGTKDIAKMTQMDTRTSTDVVILKKTVQLRAQSEHTCAHMYVPIHTHTEVPTPRAVQTLTCTHMHTLSLSHTLSLAHVHSVFSHMHSCTQILSSLTHGTLFCSALTVLIFPDFTLFSL